MEKSKIQKIVLCVYDWIFLALTIVLGALFVIQTLDLYLKGTAPGASGEIFNAEKIAEQISEISVVIFIWLAVLLMGIIYNLFFKKKEGLIDKDDVAKRRADTEYLRLIKRIDGVNKDSKEFLFIQKERQIVKYLKIIALLFALAVSIYAIIYLCIPSNFTKANVNAEILNLVKYVFPFIAVSLALFIGVSFYEKFSRVKQLLFLKSVTKGIKVEKDSKETKKERIILITRIAIATLAIAFVIWGIGNEGMRDVFQKAINICTECIGLG